ncbi:hypothetical protein D3C87_252390 [compost metagenome]
MQAVIEEKTGADTGRLKAPEFCLLVLSVISTALILGWIFRYSNYAFDFTDEGYYAVWISNPFLYDWSTTQFGFIYYPLYLLVNENLVLLRQINVVITFGLAAWLFYSVIRNTEPKDQGFSWPVLIISASFATASFVYLSVWLATPSYNSLALQALLITAIGFSLSEGRVTRPSMLGWALIGVGGWLAFMAKPTTAILLLPCFVLYVLLLGKFKIRLIAISAGTATLLLLLSALIIDGSPAAFINRLQVAAEFSSMSGAGYSLQELLRLDIFEFNETDTRFLAALTAFAAVAAAFSASPRISLKIGGCLFSAALFVIVCALAFGSLQNNFGLGRFQGLMMWAPAFAAILLTMLLLLMGKPKRIPLRFLGLLIALIAFPYAYAFGTNANYWQAASSASIFWVLAGVIAARCVTQGGTRWAGLIPLALATQVIVALLLQNGTERPYRQTQALRLNTSSVEIGSTGASVVVSEGYGAYIRDAKNLAAQAGFEPDTPIIDLTGQSPGILYILRAKSLGYPWIAGGYPGSLAVARGGLRRVSCEQIASAWLLTEPDGPRAIPVTLLDDWGGSLGRDYELAAAWQTAAGAGDYAAPRRQELYRPIRSGTDATQACVAARLERKH